MIPKYHLSEDGKSYVLDEDVLYYSKRYDKLISLSKGYKSDGATFARDIKSLSWWIHDFVCDFGRFDDGSICTNWQASFILYDILKSEGRNVRAFTWGVFTWLFGGGEARNNGMI